MPITNETTLSFKVNDSLQYFVYPAVVIETDIIPTVNLWSMRCRQFFFLLSLFQ